MIRKLIPRRDKSPLVPPVLEPMSDVMIDLETLGRRPGCAILSIGAVEFGPAGLGRELYIVLDIFGSEEPRAS
jgi:DNA polymerase III epsilon subunit-like protein